MKARPDTAPGWHFRRGVGMESAWWHVEAEPKSSAAALRVERGAGGKGVATPQPSAAPVEAE